MKAFGNYINGEFVESKSGKTFPNINPANIDEVVGHFSLQTKRMLLMRVRPQRRPRSSGLQRLPPNEANIFLRLPICWLRSCRNSARR